MGERKRTIVDQAIDARVRQMADQAGVILDDGLRLSLIGFFRDHPECVDLGSGMVAVRENVGSDGAYLIR